MLTLRSHDRLISETPVVRRSGLPPWRSSTPVTRTSSATSSRKGLKTGENPCHAIYERATGVGDSEKGIGGVYPRTMYHRVLINLLGLYPT